MDDKIYEKDPKRKEGNFLGKLSIVLFIVALFLIKILWDKMFYHPTGETWEYVKEVYLATTEYDEPPSDREIWLELKEITVKYGLSDSDSDEDCWKVIKEVFEYQMK